MKPHSLHRWWPHVLAITGGLAIGLTIRAGMKSDAGVPPSPAVAQAPREASPVVPPPKPDLFDELLFENQQQRSPAEEVALKIKIFALSSSDLRKLARRVGQLTFPEDQEAMTAIFTALGEVAPLEGIELIDLVPKNQRRAARQSILRSWVLVDADAAFAYVDRGLHMAPGYFGRQKDADLWSALTRDDPSQALERASQIADEKTRFDQENQIVRNMAFSDPEAALDWLAQHRQGSERKQAIANVIDGWSATKPREAFTFLLGLDKDAQSSDAYKNIAGSLSAELAADFRERVPEKYRNRFWGAFVERRASTSPSEAAEFASVLPEGNSRSNALYSIATQWSFTDPVATSEWISTLPRSRSRDAAVSALAHQLMTSDPEAGVTWFADMDHDGKNSPHLNNALLDWLRQDHDAAAAWMDKQTEDRLSPSLKAQVLKAFTGSK